MKHSSYIIGITILTLSKFALASSATSGVYFCTNEDESVLARVSFTNPTTCEVSLDGDGFSIMSPTAQQIRVIEGEGAFGVQINGEMETTEPFAQLVINLNGAMTNGVMGRLSGRLLIGDAHSLDGHDMTCSFFSR